MSAPIFEGLSPLVNDRYIVTLTAGEDLSVGQVVELTGDWTVRKTTALGSAKVVGVTLTNAANGKKVTVACRGLVRALTSGPIAAGDQVASGPNGTVQSYATKDTCALGSAIAAATSGGTAYVLLW